MQVTASEKIPKAGPSGNEVKGVDLQPLYCRNCGLKSRQGHGYLCAVSVVCCEVEVFETS